MNRRDFLTMLGAGTLIPMLIPSVAEAFQLGKMSEDELFNLLTSEGGKGLIVQEADVLVFDSDTRRYIRSGRTVKHHYQVTGDATELEYRVEEWESDFSNFDNGGAIGVGSVLTEPPGQTKTLKTRKRKFVPGYRVNADGSSFVNPHRVVSPVDLKDIPDGLWS